MHCSLHTLVDIRVELILAKLLQEKRGDNKPRIEGVKREYY